MEALKWADFLVDRAVDAAYRDLLGVTTKEVRLHPWPVPLGKKAFWSAWRGEIELFISGPSPTLFHSIVHELIHAILMEEGYFRLTWNQPSKTRGALSNELQHPEVFRRMKEYGLDMTPYWEYWDSELRMALANMTNDGAEEVHYNFLQVVTWFFFPEAAAPYLEKYSQFDPDLYHAAQAAYDEMSRIDCSTAEMHMQFLAVFKSRWRGYCISHLPMNELGRCIVHAIETSQMECIREKVELRTKESVYEYLRKEGFLPAT